MTPESRGSQDLLTYLRIFWRWKFLFLACLLIPPVVAFLIESGKPKVYESQTLIAFQGSAVPGAAPAAPTDLAAVARVVTTRPIARKAALFLNPPPANPSSLLDEVNASADSTTGFLTITVDDHNPQRAAAVARAFANAIGGYETAQEVQQIDLQLSALQKQLAGIPASDTGSRATVTSQIATLRAHRGASGGGVQVVEPAVVSATPVGPKTHRAVEIGLVIGLLLAIGAVLAAENSDRRLRTPEDLEALTDLRLLGVIPRTAFSPERLGDPRDEEAFQMLRAALSYFSLDRPLKSIAIISPLVGDGKTTVATGLALAAAHAGKRVILVDADLRRPQVSVRLGIEATAGLGAVLSKERKLEEVLIEHHMDTPDGGQLRVLPAGPPPPNPSALISSPEMRELLQRLEDDSDLVIVDTAAALAVSDSIPLVQGVSAVAIIVRMNRSSSAAVRRLQKVISSAEGNPMGVVATGQPPAGGYGNYYSYRYPYAQNGRGRRPRRLLGRILRRDGAGRNSSGGLGSLAESSEESLEEERVSTAERTSANGGDGTSSNGGAHPGDEQRASEKQAAQET